MVATNSHITQYLYSKLSTCFYTLNSSFLFQNTVLTKGETSYNFLIGSFQMLLIHTIHSCLEWAFLLFLYALQTLVNFEDLFPTLWIFRALEIFMASATWSYHKENKTIFEEPQYCKRYLCSFLLGFPRNKALPWIDTENCWLDLWSITNLSKRQRIHTFFYEATKRCEASKGLACILESLSLPQKETYKSLFLRPSGTPRSRSYIISLLKMLLPPVSLDA